MLGARIAMLRRSQKLSQAELAARLGVSASTVGMYEQDRRQPDCAMLVAIAQLFSVSCDFLLTGAADEHGDALLRQQFETALKKLGGSVELQAADGTRRSFSEQDMAQLFAALFG